MDKSNIPIERGSEKSFGLVFGVVFAAIGAYFLLGGQTVTAVFLLLISCGFFFTSIYKPHVLFRLNKWWFKLGLLIGAVVAPVVLFIIYCVIIVPIGLTLRVMGKELLKFKFEKDVDSYWIARVDDSQSSMKNQF